MDKKYLFGFALCIVIALFFLAFTYMPKQVHAPVMGEQGGGQQQQGWEDPSTRYVTPYGTVHVKTGERVVFEKLQLTVLDVVEDSRCPVDVQCIQAGTVKVKIEVVSGLGTTTSVLALRDSLTTEVDEIIFTTVEPLATSKKELSDDEYRLTFTVTQRDTIAEVPQPTPKPTQPPVKVSDKQCYIGGCSSQLCTDSPDIASTCEYKESYACFATATCEVQQTGECGWTQTPQLRACLSSS